MAFLFLFHTFSLFKFISMNYQSFFFHFPISVSHFCLYLHPSLSIYFAACSIFLCLSVPLSAFLSDLSFAFGLLIRLGLGQGIHVKLLDVCVWLVFILCYKWVGFYQKKKQKCFERFVNMKLYKKMLVCYFLSVCYET